MVPLMLPSSVWLRMTRALKPHLLSYYLKRPIFTCKLSPQSQNTILVYMQSTLQSKVSADSSLIIVCLPKRYSPLKLSSFYFVLGKIGDWKNLFTVAQNEEFHKVFDEWNRERQIPFIYEHSE